MTINKEPVFSVPEGSKRLQKVDLSSVHTEFTGEVEHVLAPEFPEAQEFIEQWLIDPAFKGKAFPGQDQHARRISMWNLVGPFLPTHPKDPEEAGKAVLKILNEILFLKNLNAFSSLKDEQAKDVSAITECISRLDEAAFAEFMRVNTDRVAALLFIFRHFFPEQYKKLTDKIQEQFPDYLIGLPEKLRFYFLHANDWDLGSLSTWNMPLEKMEEPGLWKLSGETFRDEVNPTANRAAPGWAVYDDNGHRVAHFQDLDQMARKTEFMEFLKSIPKAEELLASLMEQKDMPALEDILSIKLMEDLYKKVQVESYFKDFYNELYIRGIRRLQSWSIYRHPTSPFTVQTYTPHNNEVRKEAFQYGSSFFKIMEYIREVYPDTTKFEPFFKQNK